MKHLYSNLNLLVFLSFSICTSIICSEKPKKNPACQWFSHVVSGMTKRHTYAYTSFEHCRDLTILSALSLLSPAISLSILQQQRMNMKDFLKKNEESALEEVRQYWNLNPQSLSDAIKKAKDDTEFNLAAMRNPQGYNTYHNPSLPPLWINAIEHACTKHKINPKSLILDTKPTTPGYAETTIYAPEPVLLWRCYNPTAINLTMEEFHKRSSSDNHEDIVKHAALHELTHIVEGHSLVFRYITREALMNLPLGTALSNRFNGEIERKYMESSAYNNFVTAIEKTADTLGSCTDPEAAKIGAACYRILNSGYPENANDIRVLNTNWQTTRMIENRNNFCHVLQKSMQQFASQYITICALKKLYKQ